MGGVAAGVADYFVVDKAIIRVLFILALLLPPHAGWIIIAYIILWVALPEGETTTFTGSTTGSTTGETYGGTPGTASASRTFFGSGPSQPGQSAKILGFGLVAVGIVLLVDELPIWYNIRHYFWPAALIGIGAYLLLRQRDEETLHSDRDPIVTPPPAEPVRPIDPDPTPAPTPPYNAPTEPVRPIDPDPTPAPPPSNAPADPTWPTDPTGPDEPNGDDGPIRVN